MEFNLNPVENLMDGQPIHGDQIHFAINEAFSSNGADDMENVPSSSEHSVGDIPIENIDLGQVIGRPPDINQ